MRVLRVCRGGLPGSPLGAGGGLGMWYLFRRIAPGRGMMVPEWLVGGVWVGSRRGWVLCAWVGDDGL